MDTNDTFGCVRSTRNLEDVFVFTFGYHRPAAFISVLKRGPRALNSVSKAVGEPNSAKNRKPSVAI